MLSAKFWENLPSLLTIPMKCHNSEMLVSDSSVMADVLFGSVLRFQLGPLSGQEAAVGFPKLTLAGVLYCSGYLESLRSCQ